MLIYDLKVENLAAIELLTNLKALSLEWNTIANTLWDLSKNSNLKTLSIIDFPKISNIKEIDVATQIEILELSGNH
ncbi:hypothetical protein [Bacillus sp. JJ722]|uniref:hypothetical protein n=1 Tax=Bacillus sp. JJ722 TaxID=3122973 RepID=UPI0030005564